MKEFFITIFLGLISIQNAIQRDKMIVIYFSRTGNTEKFANYIQKNAIFALNKTLRIMENMLERKRIPYGIQGFEMLRNDNSYYVD